MLRSRFALVGAVVGALLVGGAVTGTTLALWQDSAPVNRGELTASTFTMTVNGSSAANLGSLAALEPGEAAVVGLDLQNTASANAENLRSDYFLDSVTASQTDLNAALEVAIISKTAVPCAVATTGFKPVGVGYTTTLVKTGAHATHTESLCLTVRLPAGAPAAAQGKSGTLNLTFRGQQVRS